MNCRFALWLAGISLIFIAGCKRIESIPKSSVAQSSAPVAILPEGTVIVDIDGEAIPPRDSAPDDRTRSAAILDALRKYTIASQKPSADTTPQDTIIAAMAWDGIDLLGITFRRSGVTLLDSVVLQITNFQNEKPTVYRWKTFNLKLVEPSDAESPNFDDLVGSLKARGIEVKEGRPSGRGLWRETLAIRRWNTTQ